MRKTQLCSSSHLNHYTLIYLLSRPITLSNTALRCELRELYCDKNINKKDALIITLRNSWKKNERVKIHVSGSSLSSWSLSFLKLFFCLSLNNSYRRWHFFRQLCSPSVPNIFLLKQIFHIRTIHTNAFSRKSQNHQF